MIFKENRKLIYKMHFGIKKKIIILYRKYFDLFKFRSNRSHLGCPFVCVKKNVHGPTEGIIPTRQPTNQHFLFLCFIQFMLSAF